MTRPLANDASSTVEKAAVSFMASRVSSDSTAVCVVASGDGGICDEGRDQTVIAPHFAPPDPSSSIDPFMHSFPPPIDRSIERTFCARRGEVLDA